MEKFSASAVANGAKPLGVGVSEPLMSILRQFTLSAPNSLRGPAMSLQNSGFRPPNVASLHEQQIQQAQLQMTQRSHPLKKVVAAPPDKPPSFPGDLLGMLTAMSHAMKPPQSPTVAPFIASVLGSRDRSEEVRGETLLEGEWISCFDVGGEKRLCLPQILTLVLRGFAVQPINQAYTNLHINCSQCTQPQLDALKISAVLPMNAANCGLITKTDAERLTNYLLQSRREANQASKLKSRQQANLTDAKSDEKPTVGTVPSDDQRPLSPATCSSASTSTAASPSSSVSTAPASPSPGEDQQIGSGHCETAMVANKRSNGAAEKCQDGKEVGTVDADDGNLPVYHECFGRCRGIFKRQLYSNASSECIQCAECAVLLAPYRFVLHSHRHHETRTCHWGFDSANWRAYLHVGGVADDEKRQHLERLLEEVKAKFVHIVAGQKRSLSLDAKNYTGSLGPAEKRQRLSDFDPNTFGGAFTPPSPLLMYDQQLICQAFLAAQKLGLTLPLPPTMGGAFSSATALLAPFAALTPALAAVANFGSVPKFPNFAGLSTTKPLTSAVADASAVEEAAAALLKLAPQIATDGGFNAQPVLESFKSKVASVVNKDFSSNDVGHSSCIGPLKRRILQRSMSKPTGSFLGRNSPVMAKNGTQAQISAGCHFEAGKTATSEDALDSLLELYVQDRNGLRLIRTKLSHVRRQLDGRLDSLASQNRILQREIAYLRNKQVGGALCSSSVSAATVL